MNEWNRFHKCILFRRIKAGAGHPTRLHTHTIFPELSGYLAGFCSQITDYQQFIIKIENATHTHIFRFIFNPAGCWTLTDRASRQRKHPWKHRFGHWPWPPSVGAAMLCPPSTCRFAPIFRFPLSLAPTLVNVFRDIFFFDENVSLCVGVGRTRAHIKRMGRSIDCQMHARPSTVSYLFRWITDSHAFTHSIDLILNVIEINKYEIISRQPRLYVPIAWVSYLLIGFARPHHHLVNVFNVFCCRFVGCCSICCKQAFLFNKKNSLAAFKELSINFFMGKLQMPLSGIFLEPVHI